MEEKYIENYIRKIEYKKLIPAFLFVGILLDILIVFELKYKINKVELNDCLSVMENTPDARDLTGEYVNVEVENLYYTGYSAKDKDVNIGNIYAYNNKGKFLFIVLDKDTAAKYSGNLKSDDTSEGNVGDITEKITIDAKVIKSDFLEDKVYEGIAGTLGFDGDIIKNISYDYVLSEVNIHIKTYYYIGIIWVICFFVVILYISSVVYIIIKPYKYKRIHIGQDSRDVYEIIKDADKEMINNLVDYYENTYITTNYQIRFKKGKVIIKKNNR